MTHVIAGEDSPRVSVVIPTTGRDSLLQAVWSALEQTYGATEVIVVFDLADVPADFAFEHPKVRILVTGGRRGANTARQLGVDTAVGDAIALLDDDDYWYPEKLERQVALLQAARHDGLRAVVSAGLQLVDHDGHELNAVPRRMIGEAQSIADYLFRRRELRWGEATMGSSSLLIDRDLLDEVRFDVRLSLHEDWDWLMRAWRRPDVRFCMVPGSQLAYREQPQGMSMSRSALWPQSVAWADANRDFLTRREYGDFLLAISVSLAVDAGDRSAALAIAARGIRRGRPGPVALFVGLGLFLFPRGSTPKLFRLRDSWYNACTSRLSRARSG